MASNSFAALALAFFAGCVTTPDGEVNLRKIHAYTVATQDTLNGFVVLYGTTDPEYAIELQQVTDALTLLSERVDQALNAGTETISIVQSIDLALVAVDALAAATIEDPLRRAKVVGVANALAGILRILRIELVE